MKIVGVLIINFPSNRYCLEKSKNTGKYTLNKDYIIKQAIQTLTIRFNTYLYEVEGNFSNTQFIVKMNKVLSRFPKEISNKYQWKRKSLKDKPLLCLENLNLLIQFSEKNNRYEPIQPDNLDVFH